MVKIFWTPEAVDTFKQEIDYIFHNWGKMQCINLLNE